MQELKFKNVTIQYDEDSVNEKKNTKTQHNYVLRNHDFCDIVDGFKFLHHGMDIPYCRK